MAARKNSKVIRVLLIIILLFVGSGAWYYQSKSRGQKPIRSVLQQVKKGTLVVSLSGSGQVSASDQIEVKAKTAGDVKRLHIKKGDEVKEGTLLAQLDTEEAERAVRDARINVASAQLNLDKLLKPADALALIQNANALEQARQTKLSAERSLEEKKQSLADLKEGSDALTLLQAQHAVEQANESDKNAKNDLTRAYEDGFNGASNAFIDLPAVMTGMQTMFFESSIEKGVLNIDWYTKQVAQWDPAIPVMQYVATASYDDARTAYQHAYAFYRETNRTADSQTIEKLIDEMVATTRQLSESVKRANNFLDSVQDKMKEMQISVPSVMTAHQSTLDAYTSTVNKHLAALVSIQQSVKQAKDGIRNADRSLEEKTENYEKLKKGPDELDILQAEHAVVQASESLAATLRSIEERERTLDKLKAGADSLDIKSAQLSLDQRKNALMEAQKKVADSAIRSPIDGVIAVFDIKKGDSVSSGASVATVVTKSRIAEITLTEVDAVRVQTGQKAALTFDALPDLTLTGVVGDIDTIGTVSQGVVSYTVKILFDAQEDRVKPGMSVSANIVLDVRQNVLLVANGALKTQGERHVVQIPDEKIAEEERADPLGVVLTMPVRHQQVQIGASNDDMTEIVSGLQEGDTIVTTTLTQQSAFSTKNQQQGFRVPGLPGSGQRGGGGGFRGQ